MPQITAPLKHAVIKSACILLAPVSAMKLRRAVARAGHAAKLQLGSGGAANPAWINIDFNFRTQPDIVLDLTRPLPLPDNCVRYIFTEDFIEHISLHECERMLAECHRVLRPGGVMRILTPDLALLVQQYQGRDPAPLTWYREHFGVQTHGQMLNAAYQALGHRFIYDRETLELAATRAGLETRAASFKQGLVSEMADMDQRTGCLAMDAIKPGAPPMTEQA